MVRLKQSSRDRGLDKFNHQIIICTIAREGIKTNFNENLRKLKNVFLFDIFLKINSTSRFEVELKVKAVIKS